MDSVCSIPVMYEQSSFSTSCITHTLLAGMQSGISTLENCLPFLETLMSNNCTPGHLSSLNEHVCSHSKVYTNTGYYS